MSGKKIVYFPQGSYLGRTAVKSSQGFWYVGDVLDSSDLAYGVLYSGVIEKEETDLVEKILKVLFEKGKVNFYDIGANTGYYGILAAWLGQGKACVYSFEPQKKYAGCLKETATINNLAGQVKIFEYGLGAENSTATFHLAGSGSSLDASFLENKNLPTQKIEVKKLDDVIAIEKLGSPDFIKIDVEGFEYKVLQGSKQVIKSSLPVLFIEIAYSLKAIGRTFTHPDYSGIFNMLKDFGYSPYLSREGRLGVYDPNRKLDGVNMFLFLHQNKHASLIKQLIL
ncbi:MAG: FkbM family methyltransferase [Candidatus Doudnabacteria bacterium]|nr:FkbM family methyltransferase [Candidatus Doudnabacteria bacterium]